MDETKPATETTIEPAQTIAPEDDLEAKLAKLEAEKENYRKAYLKEAAKKEEPANETEDDEITRKVNAAIANTKLAEIAREQQEIITKALKENKELKLAQLNKTNAPVASMGSHSEGVTVKDTLITPEQMTFFKAKNWSDKDIERYKKNLAKGGGR